jgi:hypothetical protein
MVFTLLVQSDPPSAPGSLKPASYVWIGLIALSFFVIVILPRLRRKRGGAPEALGTFGPSSMGPREELERLLTEIQDLSREHIARLDTKIRLLNQLLLECDQKKRELEALLGKTVEPAEKRVDSPPVRPPTIRASNPLHDQVYTLQDSGKEVLDICAATGLEKGEVELILGLRRMRPS